jgi:phosphatidylinositol 3-kinase
VWVVLVAHCPWAHAHHTQAYNILRKSANLIINLFLLMSGANIPDIAADPEKTILKLEAKFALDLDDEAAVQHFQALINESANALFPQMMETAHRWAQYWR